MLRQHCESPQLRSAMRNLQLPKGVKLTVPPRADPTPIDETTTLVRTRSQVRHHNECKVNEYRIWSLFPGEEQYRTSDWVIREPEEVDMY